MELFSYLQEVTQKFGPSGHEYEVAEWLKSQFEPFCDSVTIDSLYNVIALKKATRKRKDGKPAPKVMIVTHQDEIALMVSAIEEDGSIRLGNVGGVDPRVLPASTVTVHASKTNEKLIGVVGATPPHLLGDSNRSKNYLREELFVDCGFTAENLHSKVDVGDLITLNGPTTKLLNGRMASKTMDDRVCCGISLDTAERIQNMSHICDIYFVCASQEEVGCKGAGVAAYTIQPDMAYIMDVTHATLPNSRPDTTLPLEAPAITFGPFVQYKLVDALRNTAKKHSVTLNEEHAESRTGTDTDSVQIAGEGVPCVLINLPLKYMHTAVEVVSTKAVTETARLLSHALSEMQEGWDDDLWI